MAAVKVQLFFGREFFDLWHGVHRLSARERVMASGFCLFASNFHAAHTKSRIGLRLRQARANWRAGGAPNARADDPLDLLRSAAAPASTRSCLSTCKTHVGTHGDSGSSAGARHSRRVAQNPPMVSCAKRKTINPEDGEAGRRVSVESAAPEEVRRRKAQRNAVGRRGGFWPRARLPRIPAGKGTRRAVGPCENPAPPAEARGPGGRPRAVQAHDDARARRAPGAAA